MKISAFLLFLVILFGLFLAQADFLARYAWEHYQNGTVALLLNRNDSRLAMEVGDHFYGGQANIGASNVYNLEKAKLAYQTAVRIDNSILWGHYQLARIYFVEGNFPQALSEINKELELNPSNLRALYIRGLIYGFREGEGDLQRAEDDFRAFTAWAPSEWAGYNDLNWILLKQGKYTEVKEISKIAFQAVPDGDLNAWLLNALGVAQLNLKEYRDAYGVLKRALIASQKLTEEDWQKAYSGNNPRASAQGLAEFREGIEKNIRIAEISR